MSLERLTTNKYQAFVENRYEQRLKLLDAIKPTESGNYRLVEKRIDVCLRGYIIKR